MATRLPPPTWHQHVSFGISVLIVTAGIWVGAHLLQASQNQHHSSTGQNVSMNVAQASEKK